MTWLVDNIASVAVLLAVLFFLSLLVFSLVKSKKNGNSSCACCRGCAMAGKCARFREEEKE